MSDQQRSIFRPDAVRRYLAGREQSVLPRLITPQTFAWLWIIVILLIVATVGVLAFGLPLGVLTGIAQ